ncbi:hypothetical protein [Mycobacterium sp. DL440]|uniref:hypothetical protein n=1 Tax=Mycobacterium sp. DL440 TaxID=2675523 RepID=UPI00141F54DB|nr:hypothetical protein [Mycobacterium sp. DL440]
MSLPPPPGSFGQQPPMGGGGQPGGAPQPWQQQPGGPAGPPSGGPPPWGPQQQWAGGPPPPNGGGKTKWILGGLAAVLAIALAVVVTVLVVKPDNGGNGPSNVGANGSNSEFASANDTGPVNIITEDPTCAPWTRVSQDYADRTNAVNWGDRDSSVPATAWSPEQRNMYETVGNATTDAANRTQNLVKQTPHRVMRELYQQFIAYAHAFVDAIPSYVADRYSLSITLNAVGLGIANICSAIDYGSAQAIAPLVPKPEPPSAVPTDQPTMERFLTSTNPVCAEWEPSAIKFDADTAEWRQIDPNLPADKWNPEQRALSDAAIPLMFANADTMERMGRQSKNAVLEDVAVLAAQYQRGFANALPNYRLADNFLSAVTSYLVKGVSWGCKAVS